jgi:hypothetical protein
MIEPFEFCRRLLPAAVMLAAATVPARGETFDAGTAWKGNIVRNGNGQLESCAVLRDFEDNSVLSFALTRDRDFFLVVGNPRFHLPEGETRTVRYRVDKGLVYEAPADMLRQSAIIDLPDADGTQDLLRHGDWLFLDGLGDDVGYALDGARQSLRAMSDCVARGLAAETAAPVVAAAPAAGGAEVELGTYAAEPVAREDWQHMKKVLGGLLDGREPTFATRTRSKDGRAFTVVRIAGFAGRDEAMRFCKAMQAKKRECTAR